MLIAITYMVGVVLTYAIFAKLGQDWARADLGHELDTYDKAEVHVFSALIALVWPIVAVTVLVHVAKKMLGNNLP